MHRSWIRNLVTSGCVFLAIVALQATVADAGWHSTGSSGGSWGSSGSHGSHGSWGSRGSSGGSWGSHGSSGGSWGSHGSSGGILARHHHRKMVRRAFYSSGSHGSHGSWGSHGSSGGSSGGGYHSAPAESAPEEAAPATEDAVEATEASAKLTVHVPEDAQVFINGAATTSTGSLRSFVSRHLSRNYRYTYEVRVTAERDGKLIEETKTVKLEAGRSAELNFALNASQVETFVKLNVPEDALVTLAGNATKSTGATRNFRTTTLQQGQSWANYKIVVTVERNGETLAQEKTLELTAGDSVEFDFDFDELKVAAR